MLENNQKGVNTADFLNFIRPDTRYGKKWYEGSTAETVRNLFIQPFSLRHQEQQGKES